MLERCARRFVAGSTLDHALATVRQDNAWGIYGLINFLGEHYEDEKQVDAAVVEYKNVLNEIQRRKLDAQLSVKPSQLGMMVSYETCRKNLLNLLEGGTFVWIDMESSRFTEQTLRLFSDVFQHRDNVGITLQACLKRTEQDLEALLARDAVIRLVKGAYKEDANLLVENVLERYKDYMETLFENGGRFAIATHSPELIAFAAELEQEHEDEAEPEFQLLLGVREGLQARLAKEGFRVGEYIPYGTRWQPYLKRRLKENRTNTLRAAKDFFWYSHERLYES